MWGGVFALSQPGVTGWESRIPALGKNLFCFNARSALHLLLKYLRPPQVWLPTYLCPELLKALPPEQDWHFYEHTPGPHVQPDIWPGLKPQDLVLTIAYLGFEPDPDWLALLRARGARVLIDASQALFLSSRHGADYLLYSPRKWGGVSEGGILAGPDLPAQPNALPTPQAGLEMAEAMALRREFDQQGQDDSALQARWFALFRQAEAHQPVGAWPMSAEAIGRWFQLRSDPLIQQRRRDNYLHLLDSLAEWALYPALPQATVPLAFALRVKQRDALQNALAQARIYCPVYWPLAGAVPDHYSQSHRLSEELLCLPCDQRYGLSDMAEIAAQVLAWKHYL